MYTHAWYKHPRHHQLALNNRLKATEDAGRASLASETVSAALVTLSTDLRLLRESIYIYNIYVPKRTPSWGMLRRCRGVSGVLREASSTISDRDNVCLLLDAVSRWALLR